MLKIHMKQNIKFLLKTMKILEQSVLIFQKLLLNTQTMWLIFIRILKIIIQIKNVKY